MEEILQKVEEFMKSNMNSDLCRIYTTRDGRRFIKFISYCYQDELDGWHYVRFKDDSVICLSKFITTESALYNFEELFALLPETTVYSSLEAFYMLHSCDDAGHYHDIKLCKEDDISIDARDGYYLIKYEG